MDLRHGDRLHVLWYGVSKRYCAASMAQIGSVVEECLDRHRAEFTENDMHMSSEALNVIACLGAAGARREVLRHKARVLVEAAGLPSEWDQLLCAIREVERDRRKRIDKDTFDNRVFRASVFDEGQGGTSPVAPFAKSVAFYLCLQDRTGSIERFGGRKTPWRTTGAGQTQRCLPFAWKLPGRARAPS